MIRGCPLLPIFCFASEAVAPLRAEIPPGPSWLEKAVFYQIYPQSYYDSNGDGIGDLPGITAKLDYISSIGCNAIWINPIFVSPFGDAGYDVADFYKVAPRYLLSFSTGTQLWLCSTRPERALATPND